MQHPEVDGEGPPRAGEGGEAREGADRPAVNDGPGGAEEGENGASAPRSSRSMGARAGWSDVPAAPPHAVAAHWMKTDPGAAEDEDEEEPPRGPDGRRIRYTRGPLLDSKRMHPQRFQRGYWDALYELWRLSWFEWGADTTQIGARLHSPPPSPHVSVPRPVTLGRWLAAVASTDRAMARAYEIAEGGGEAPAARGEPADDGEGGAGFGSDTMITADFLTSPHDPQLTNQMRLSWLCQLNADWRPLRLAPQELVHLAGALQRAELITSRFHRPVRAFARREGARPTLDPCRPQRAAPELVYFVDPRVALQLQHFLANWVVDQDLRPGPPGCADQHRALTMGAYKKYAYSGRFAPMMAIRHQTLAAEAVERSIAAMEVDQAWEDGAPQFRVLGQ